MERADRLRHEGVDYVITDESGKIADERAIARGDILSPRDEETSAGGAVIRHVSQVKAYNEQGALAAVKRLKVNLEGPAAVLSRCCL